MIEEMEIVLPDGQRIPTVAVPSHDDLPSPKLVAAHRLVERVAWMRAVESRFSNYYRLHQEDLRLRCDWSAWRKQRIGELILNGLNRRTAKILASTWRINRQFDEVEDYEFLAIPGFGLAHLFEVRRVFPYYGRDTAYQTALSSLIDLDKEGYPFRCYTQNGCVAEVEYPNGWLQYATAETRRVAVIVLADRVRRLREGAHRGTPADL